MSTLEEPRHAAGLQVPALADGVELLGASQGSGYRRPPCLVRRGDGQVVQLTPLLYAVLEAVDGRRDLAAVATCASEAVDRAVTHENVDHLIREQLLPLGFLRLADGSQPELRKSTPLLGLRFRREVTDPHTTQRLTAPFAVLFQPVLVVGLLVAFFAVCWWVGWEKGLASATHEALYTPGLLLLVFALTALSAGFHEFGHAAGAKYGGARPGTMGAGLYLVWPAFYTDVTDSYRLGRAGRLRTDLGGLYFNAIFAIGVFGVWMMSRWDFLLLVVVTQVIQMLRQLAPLVRFDGYHVLADLTGVPDLYHHIRPILRGLLPRHWDDPSTKVLKPRARAVVTAWVLIFVPLMLLGLALMVIAFPRLAATAVDSIRDRGRDLVVAYGDGDLTTMAATALSIVAITLPILGLVYVVARLVRQVSGGVWKATEGRPAMRGLAVMLALALVAGLLWAWWPKEDRYRPIAAYESGTVADVIPAASQGRPGVQVGSVSSGATLWPAARPLPTRSEPVLAVVLVPQQGKSSVASPAAEEVVSAPPATWVFPFDRPPAPEDGDTQAVAVNTEDGTIVYDVAFALVWAEEGEAADNVNSAYALASCAKCGAVAVSFQVLLVVGEVNQITPQNLAAAVNYNCIECVTYALAQQLVVTLDGPLGEAAMAELTALWAQIAVFAQGISRVPLSEIADYLQGFQDRVIEIIAKDTGPLPTSSPARSPAPGAPSSSNSPSPPGETTEPETSPTAGPSGSTTPGPSAGAPEPTPTPSPSASATVPSDTPSTPGPSESASP